MKSGASPMRLNETLVFRVALITLGLALLFRLWPLVAGMPALAQFFVTEDGYLMLTVARNLATGLGLSVSEGTIPTNGVQPLATLLYAIPYAITGGDKITSLSYLHALWAAISVAGALAVRALAGRIMTPMGLAPAWSWLVAALWFSGPLLVKHTMNGLETGLCSLLLVLACLQFMRVVDQGAAVRPGALMLMAALLGLMFLGRNDTVFFLLALALIWLVHALVSLRLAPALLARQLVVPILILLVLVAPWLVHNKLLFGSIVPISGTAQSFASEFAHNIHRIPGVLFEQMFPMLPLPRSIADNPVLIVVAGSAVLGVLLPFLWRAWKIGGAVRLVVLAYLAHVIAVSLYYGLFFGAPHFLARYTSPLAPLFIIAMVTVVRDLVQRLARARAEAVSSGLALGGLALSVALMLRLLIPGANVQGHFQVVNWVNANVAPDIWVGAIQTGTLGYWHDRTINLDGKVNPDALAARRATGTVFDYVKDSKIDYLADWIGIATWVDRDGFGESFEIIVSDPEQNLGVLGRR